MELTFRGLVIVVLIGTLAGAAKKILKNMTRW